MSVAPRDGDWVRIEHFGRHRAVVLRVIGASHCIVLYATSSLYPDKEHNRVMPDEAYGRQLGLTLPTYFYRNNCIPKRTPKILEVLGRCPPRLFQELRLLTAPLLSSLEHLTSAEIDQLADQADRRDLARRTR